MTDLSMIFAGFSLVQQAFGCLMADSPFSPLKTTPVRDDTFRFWIVSLINIHVPAFFL